MDALHRVEGPRIEQLPRSKNVYLMSPDRARVIKGDREIEEKKDFRIQNSPPQWTGRPPASKHAQAWPCSQGCHRIADLLRTRE